MARSPLVARIPGPDATPAMTSIVVGLGGGRSSFVALDWAADRALRGGTRVEIVMIAGTVFSDGDRFDQSIADAERRLREKAPDVQTSSRRFPGRMPDSLFEHSGAADLLVIGRHRRPGRWTLTGRLPHRIASHSRVPVVVVPDGWSPRTGPVVLGVDEDDSSRTAVHVAAGEAHEAGVPLTMVHAWNLPDTRVQRSAYVDKGERGAHSRVLDGAAIVVARAHPGVRIERRLVEGDAGEAILACEEDASLIVIGTHHRGLFAGVVIGSVGLDVLSRSAIPVCVVPNSRDAPPD